MTILEPHRNKFAKKSGQKTKGHRDVTMLPNAMVGIKAKRAVTVITGGGDN